MDGSLFRAVDVGELETKVLAEADQRARDASIPQFFVSSKGEGLGFGPSSLGSFCSTTDPFIFRLAADVARREGRELREGGVGNLAARDRVQMKTQILRGLLRDRCGDDGQEEAGAAGRVEAASRSEEQSHEDLVKTGAVTPLDAFDDPTIGLAGRRRKTLQDYKVAEGMTVKLPRSRRPKARTRESVRKQAESGNDSCGELDNAETSIDSSTFVQPQRSSRGDGGVSAEKNAAVQCPVCAQMVMVDDPANPDICLSRHMDRCTRSARRRSCRQAGEARGLERGSDASTRPRASSRGGSGSTSKRRGQDCDANGGHLAAKSRSSALADHLGTGVTRAKRRRASGRALVHGSESSETDTVLKVLGGGQSLVDDFDDEDFETRKAQVVDLSVANGVGEDSLSANSAELGDGLILEDGIAQRLFQFQRTGVRWMWQLHRQGAGGIVGDEMGLGKTVQVSAFLGALHGSSVMRRALILCPATVLSHWMAELHVWAPQLRVVVLHRCVQAFNAVSGNSGKLRALIRRILGWPEVVVVASYEGMKSLKAFLLPCNWDYCVLDEGQRIRNPDAEVTLICKQIRTVHRLILTGTPIQNNLRELWSLFDFVFPGRLGTLPAFEAEFANPIRVGGYANARQVVSCRRDSPMQARLAYRCALVLRDLIQPYLLRRQKKDLEDIIHLPAKTEQVLFCRLTSYQRRLYSEFLESTEVKSVLSRTMRSFRAIGILRKLCNHPDLVCRFGDSVVTRLASHQIWGGDSDASEKEEDDTAEESKSDNDHEVQRSGKLLVLQQILPLWHKQGHRVLLFSQTRQMLSIIERFVVNNEWSYGRLDGSTPVGNRQALIDRFNNDESMFIMLLTTRTGGVGVNLTGADRVILFDPDWNPSTDMQARERSWRVGQLRQVTVYRLVTAGTIEEKIYHRQIFKTALTNRVLQDPKQRRMFSADELGDLFTLGDDGASDGFTDTIDLFQGEGRIRFPQGEQQGSKSRRSEGASDVQRKNGRKKSPSRRGNRVARRESASPSSSPLLGTATVTVAPASGDEERKSSVDGDQDSEKSKGDDKAVLQALYESAPLSSVFHHDLAEGSGRMTMEQKRMEEAAKRAAQRAVNQLRMSRRTLRAGAGQGGFQSSWTGRNGGTSAENTSQDVPRAGNLMAGANVGAGRRFGTVSNPSIAGRQGGREGQDTAFLGQQEPASAPGQSSSAGVSSQVGPFFSNELYVRCTPELGRPYVLSTPLNCLCTTMFASLFVRGRTFCDRFASAMGHSQLRRQEYSQSFRRQAPPTTKTPTSQLCCNAYRTTWPKHLQESIRPL
ncbi:unnamed protein product [Ectocarpus sp. 8 AP-2014]